MAGAAKQDGKLQEILVVNKGISQNASSLGS